MRLRQASYFALAVCCSAFSAITQAQTLDTFELGLVCVGEPGADFRNAIGCEPGENNHDDFIRLGTQARDLWRVVRPGQAKVNTQIANGQSLVTPVFHLSPLPPAAKARLARAETPVFFDPETGMLYLLTASSFPDASLYGDQLGVGLERNLGLALMSAYPPLKAVLIHPDQHPDLISAMEGIANSLSSISSDAIGDGLSYSRDFSVPLFSAPPDQTGNWGSGAFWAKAYELAQKRQAGQTGSRYYQAVMTALGATGDRQSSSLSDLWLNLDNQFQGLGYDQFKASSQGAADGFNFAYAETMAAHHLDPSRFQSLEEQLLIDVDSEPVAKVINGRLTSFSTDFFTLSLTPSQRRTGRLTLSVCENIGSDCVTDTENAHDLHLLIDGYVVDPRLKGGILATGSGLGGTIVRRNEIDIVVPNAADMRGLSKQSQPDFKIGVAFTGISDPVRYSLKVSTTPNAPSCTWASMASTLNPWWRGDLDSPQALIPNDPDIPAQFKMELSQELRKGWYLSEQTYRNDVGYDGHVFDGHLTEVKLRTLTGDASDVVVPQAYQSPSATDERDRAFRTLMPSEAKLKLSGAVEDGGTVCVSPIAVSEMPDFMSIANSSEVDILADMGLPKELLEAAEMDEWSNMDDAQTAAAMAAILMGQALESEDMENDARDVMLQIYSPNLFTQQLGMLFPGQSLPLVHNGLGGWAPNAGFNLYIRLPGTSALDLAPGTYDAVGIILPDIAKSAETEPSDIEGEPPFYVWGERNGSQINWLNYRAPSLTGTLRIDKQISGAAIAALSLSGETYEQSSAHPCNRENQSSVTPDCSMPNAGIDKAGLTTITIDRMFLLGVSEGEPLPVQNMFNLTTARIPNPNTRSFE